MSEMKIDPVVAYRELQVQFEFLRQRNLVLAQQLDVASKELEELKPKKAEKKTVVLPAKEVGNVGTA
ncbi:hypothetical protein [Aquamicrobium sp. LC103]|uniref:hypothetical protein n=1 Tax=Aquamicrobium sp. LC103 TaxID=1120658 RepID=UPI00063EC32B|nr:hypothetical protein [Aquamicrobium sp. LC103]TKT78439.1 hypothetical protein XW59_012550 [Aquamicrobium sp. LC103]